MKRQRLSICLKKAQIGARPLARQRDAGLPEPVDEVDADDEIGLLGEGKRHPAATAPGVEHPPADPAADTLEMCEDLGAAVILEEGVVVLGPEAAVRVLLDQGVIDNAHHAIVPAWLL